MFLHRMFDIGNIIQKKSCDSNDLFGGWNTRLMQWEIPPKFNSYEECLSFINSEKKDTLHFLWKEFNNISFDKNSEELILVKSWYVFAKGTTRTEIQHWFDEQFSKDSLQQYVMNMQMHF